MHETSQKNCGQRMSITGQRDLLETVEHLCENVEENIETLLAVEDDLSSFGSAFEYFSGKASSMCVEMIAFYEELTELSKRLISGTEEQTAMEEDDCVSQGDSNIRYWMYEFEMPLEIAEKIDAYCEKAELTTDEFFVQILKDTIDHPELLKLTDKEEMPDQEIKLIRTYPVHLYETEAQALKKAIWKEKKRGI